MIPHSNLKLLIEVVGKYGLQPQELNISLTAVGLLVRRWLFLWCVKLDNGYAAGYDALFQKRVREFDFGNGQLPR